MTLGRGSPAMMAAQPVPSCVDDVDMAYGIVYEIFSRLALERTLEPIRPDPSPDGPVFELVSVLNGRTSRRSLRTGGTQDPPSLPTAGSQDRCRGCPRAMGEGVSNGGISVEFAGRWVM